MFSYIIFLQLCNIFYIFHLGIILFQTLYFAMSLSLVLALLSLLTIPTSPYPSFPHCEGAVTQQTFLFLDKIATTCTRFKRSSMSAELTALGMTFSTSA